MIAITDIDTRDAETTVYNFTVAGDHNYYVTDAQLLVHNCPVGRGGMTPNHMNTAIRRSQAPRGIVRIDVGMVTGEQTHAGFGTGRGAPSLNMDGTWKHGFVNLTNAQRDWLIANGWDL